MPAIDLDTLLDLVGSLNDSNEPGSASDRFRKYLHDNVTAAVDVRAYIERALSQSGDQYNKALQDLVNHVGQLLEFEVIFGRYRGVRNEIGFDGLWKSPKKNHALVVETKTTDTYTVKTATLLGYINSLVSDGVISDPSSALGLYVMGRFDADTNQLENAIIVEGRRERLRLVSVPSLISLLELKQEYHLAHETVLDLLLPSPIKIDPIVELIRNVVAQEQERDGVELELDTPTAVIGTDQPKAMIAERTKPRTSRHVSSEYTSKKVRAIDFDGQRVEVTKWREALEAVMALMVEKDQQRFVKVAPTIVGKKRPYITKNPDLLRQAGRVAETDFYFETNISATYIVKIANELIEKMGYRPELLVFETD
jgi:hypothetical protein